MQRCAASGPPARPALKLAWTYHKICSLDYHRICSLWHKPETHSASRNIQSCAIFQATSSSGSSSPSGSCMRHSVPFVGPLCCVCLQETPDLRIESSGMCRALFEVFLGSNTVVPDAIPTWAEGTKKLLESEEVRRATRRGGSG